MILVHEDPSGTVRERDGRVRTEVYNVFDPQPCATMDVATRQIALLPALGTGKHINPHFAPDGRSVYFIGDPDGVPDVYEQDLRP